MRRPAAAAPPDAQKSPRWLFAGAVSSLALLEIIFSLGCTSADPLPEPLDCAAVGAWSTDVARVDNVEAIPASEEQPAHCKVAGTIDTEVHFELVLPLHDAWNGRFVRDYYGQDIAHSYFIGCSRGGGQAMVEAQRFPDDYDGLVAMAPAFTAGPTRR